MQEALCPYQELTSDPRSNGKENYEEKRNAMGQEPEDKPLRVFSVSARAFNEFTKKDKEFGCRHGFFTKRETRIPGLRDALISTTWELREFHAKVFNNEARRILGKLKDWSADTMADFKMSVADRAVSESQSGTQVVQLWEASLPQIVAPITVLDELRVLISSRILLQSL